jgi:hypothetical protein
LTMGKWKIPTILLILLIIHINIPHLALAQPHTWLDTKTEKILLAEGIEIPTIPSNDPIEIPKVEIPSDPIEIPKVKIPENKIEVPKAEIPKAPVQESTGFIDQLLKWLQQQLSLILALLCMGLGLFFLSTNPLVGISIVMGMAVGGFGAWMADKDVSGIAQEAIIGALAGLVGLGAGALAFRLIGGRIATLAPPWLGKWLPSVGSGGVAGVADSASFDYMRDGKVDWKKAGLVGLLGVAIGFACMGVAQYGGKLVAPTIVSKINDIPLTAVSVFKDGTTFPKTVGDTPFGVWLQKFASNGNHNTVKFKSGFDTHFTVGEGIGKGKKGVVGGHNMHDFYKTLETTGMDPSNLIISKQQHPTFPGLYEVRYKIPSLTYGPDGKLIPSGQFKTIRFPKTVYDPNVYTDAQMIQWGKEAMEEGIKAKRITGREVEGYSSNGMKFRGYINDQGEITNFFPTFK